ncbi:hypothetical protein ACFQ5D_11395 [Paenibacillus farraposensis]|uniref:Uncharacterized protein n=1 Tax=Paenibacillus farraposensis TaxID=2807095 RepID=A0ABW4DD65_9BACL|nr:hypothetical protein [Paenibacillus farraposensis]MCC3378654.1 hypothetical protein [Paenibacillus farraposensis]
MSMRREREIKLDMMESIAASQHAVARMLSSLADLTPHADVSAARLEETIRILSNYQGRITQMLAGIPIRRQVFGKPAQPWLHIPVPKQVAITRKRRRNDNEYQMGTLLSEQSPQKTQSCPACQYAQIKTEEKTSACSETPTCSKTS